MANENEQQVKASDDTQHGVLDSSAASHSGGHGHHAPVPMSDTAWYAWHISTMRPRVLMGAAGFVGTVIYIVLKFGKSRI